MPQFLKSLLASCLGIFIAFALLFGIGSIAIGRMVASADQPKPVKPNSVLHLTFKDAIPEQTNNLEIDPFAFNKDNTLGLTAITAAIGRAAEDDRIKGVFLEPDMLLSTGLATNKVIHDALLKFKESGKFVVAYSNYYVQGAYYLAATADEVWLNPLGIVDFRGFSSQIPFFKDMLDRVGVNMQVYYAGKFKGATEPYRFNELSEENRLQIRTYLDDIYADFLSDLSADRGIEDSQLRALANAYTGMDPEAALDAGLIDGLGHRDVAISALRERLGLDSDEKIPQIGLTDYAKSNPVEKDYSVKDKIAIIYAEGAIVDGKANPGTIGDKDYTSYIKEAREDERVKALVLRVNSPGGSAMASENIWREIRLTQEAGKPVVVSMGDYAASGGYYISASADSIFAEPNTLTGSIGVFSLIPDASELLEENMGIHFDTVKTGAFSLGITPFHPMSAAESQLLQARTEQMYETFLSRVSEGRGMSRDDVHEIAQGRVWTGSRGVGIGLVDAIGGLSRALQAAASLADLEAYRTTEYPRVKDPIQQILEEFMGEESVRSKAILRSELGTYYPYYEYAKQMSGTKSPQARLPFLISTQ
ncbi:signal peptide peptidase SppA [Phaeodactylibacter luteus]|uniref:Signal peptide peptidase SppA n=1 Tax=Phaeodactylibacter luteus TaxID=1564516 RepID=A0A5C6S731_9BACT|nr:signal peptide peptidase SppA [Phaeodactylibacter luteus]TXB70209.1 signal peptide peptidase SppA [Phaeodactylibacter luteus]